MRLNNNIGIYTHQHADDLPNTGNHPSLLIVRGFSQFSRDITPFHSLLAFAVGYLYMITAIPRLPETDLRSERLQASYYIDDVQLV